MLTDEQWAALGPLIEACRPPAKVASSERGEVAGGAGVPGPWWTATQRFIRWSGPGVREQLTLMQKDRVRLACMRTAAAK